MKKNLSSLRFRAATAGAARPEPMPTAGDRIFCGDLDIRIDRDGTWYYAGSPIRRKELVCLFASVLTVDAAGHFWLITPTEIGRITVEDAPFVAVEMFTCGCGCVRMISFRTNVDEIVTLDHDHRLRFAPDPETGQPSPYVTVRRGMEARLARPVYYELVDLALAEPEGEGRGCGVWSSGTFFPIGTEPRHP